MLARHEQTELTALVRTVRVFLAYRRVSEVTGVGTL